MDVQTFTPGPTVEEAEVQENVLKTVAALNEIASNAQSLSDCVNGMVEQMKKPDFQTAAGLSLLELRNLLLLNYMSGIVGIIERKCNGESLQTQDARSMILRIVEMRTSLEKIKPIHLKLKYRIEKLVKAANINSVDPNDPLNLKPNLQALDLDEEVGDVDAGESNSGRDASSSTKGSSKGKKYVVPKVSAVPYDEDTGEVRKNKLLERAKKRALSSNLMQELRGELDDAPEEINEMSLGRKKMLKEMQERVRYEEEHFTRINVQKHKKSKEKSLMTIGDLGTNITMFDDVSALDKTMEDMNIELEKGVKKRKSLSGSKKKTKKKKNMKAIVRRIRRKM